MTGSPTLSPQAAATAVTNGGLVAFVVQRDRIRVSGPDAAMYLQGQLSQQIEGLALGESRWSLLLQPQGKVDGWMRVLRTGSQAFWLDLDPGAGDGALARLERFKLRTDAGFVLDTVQLLALRGPGSLDLVADGRPEPDVGVVRQPSAEPESGAEGDTRAGQDRTVLAFAATWDGLAGVDVSVDDPAAWAGDHGLRLVDGGAGSSGFGEALRVWQGRPAVGAELDDSTIPAAAGIVEISVDFTKGCYVGQELVARVDSRGSNTPTNLHRLSAPAGAELSAGQELFALDENGSPGDSVGKVTSTAVWPIDNGLIGLGYLKRSVTGPVALTTSDGVPVQVRS